MPQLPSGKVLNNSLDAFGPPSPSDTTRLRSRLGWEPHTRLDEGLARQWHWQEGLASGTPAPGHAHLQPTA